jgi:hypothetical protein
MRGLLILVVIVGLGYLFLRQKQNEKSSSAAATLQSVPTASSSLTPAPRGQASEYNYMKRALDRASDVRDQARARTQEAQDPH